MYIQRLPFLLLLKEILHCFYIYSALSQKCWLKLFWTQLLFCSVLIFKILHVVTGFTLKLLHFHDTHSYLSVTSKFTVIFLFTVISNLYVQLYLELIFQNIYILYIS